MRSFPPRVVNAIFKNRFTFVGTIALVAAVILLSILGIRYAYNQYARRTFMKPFYEKVALAEMHSQDVPLENLVARATTHASPQRGNGKRSGWLNNCTPSGTYFDYAHNQTLSNVSFCSYGYISYFWVNALDDNTIDLAAQRLQSRGWNLLQDSEDQVAIKQRTQASTPTLTGYSFSRADGTHATMTFIKKDFWRLNSGDYSGYPEWNFVKKTDDPHQYFIAITISYSATLQGSRFIER